MLKSDQVALLKCQNLFKFLSLFKHLEASYYSRFETSIFGADFNEENIKKNNSLTLRKKKGVSIDECCRLCITEPAFDCQSLSYEVIQGECKWSSFVGALNNFLEGNPYLIEDSAFVWYTSKL
jgi:hypothetical protein